MNIKALSASFKVISSLQLASSTKKMKNGNFLLNFDLQKATLWLLFQGLMVISRGSLAHGGMCVRYTYGNNIIQFNV